MGQFEIYTAMVILLWSCHRSEFSGSEPLDLPFFQGSCGVVCAVAIASDLPDYSREDLHRMFCWLRCYRSWVVGNVLIGRDALTGVSSICLAKLLNRHFIAFTSCNGMLASFIDKDVRSPGRAFGALSEIGIRVLQSESLSSECSVKGLSSFSSSNN
ncbi:hypothetical protein L6164_027717 [Bauhinia variegata]|uniref:Uncharacterized protein n=1 Tax=Bauhinia variegata TaxID=167791 RepID=A0ACB9LU35_BAUVA|nr:hypothetical protein L6164_027717 [Bauhinia variegata]